MSSCMISFRGPEAPAWVLDGLRRGEIAAVCLFAYNFRSLEQLRELNLSLMAAAADGGHPPPLIGIDQEGGQLMAVTAGATELPGNMALGATRSPELAREAGAVLGRELLALGCNLNFAPVLDLATQLESNVVGLRAFSDEPGLASELGAALIQGMQQAGVLATAKHFPGHGDTKLDTHHAAPRIDRTLEQLLRHELVPFRAAIAAGVGAVMSCHARFPALDDPPATLSRQVMHDLLRDRLGFGGLLLTDALDMQAVARHSALERTRLALEAGADLALLGHLPDQETLLRKLAPETTPAAAARISEARRGLPTELPPLEVIGGPEHQEVARRIAEASVTLVRGEPHLDLRPADRLLLISVRAGDLTSAETSSGSAPRLAEQIRRRHPGTTDLTLPYGSGSEALRELLEAVAAARPERIVVATVNAASDPVQVELLRELARRGHDPVVVALRSPLDAHALPFVNALLCAYGRRAPQTEAVARVLFREIVPVGQLPVNLPSEEVGV